MAKIESISVKRLVGVHPGLAQCITKSIEAMPYLVRVTCGLRTPEEQKILFRLGKTRTLNSNHFVQRDKTGHAVDVVAIIKNEPDWADDRFFEFAENMRAFSRAMGLDVTWGAIWDSPLRLIPNETLEAAHSAFVAKFLRINKRRPFHDAPHFEISH